jgi:hypothetical protein
MQNAEFCTGFNSYFHMPITGLLPRTDKASLMRGILKKDGIRGYHTDFKKVLGSGEGLAFYPDTCYKGGHLLHVELRMQNY